MQYILETIGYNLKQIIPFKLILRGIIYYNRE
ncbi:Uncharacterised protein [Bergeyella zoohelcum]|uniref:Uncharacterized protein n=1 Tax=Bergeyella zoohelcum TaxID=1015 RepID=A0A7Z9CGE2_9FLAO|nr:Uncharacterised protein [Bergeyella zoohelcum]